MLFDTPHMSGHIVGDTKLFCLIDNDLADCFMAMTDAVFIVELLEAVSAKYKINWTLSLAGSPCGHVINGTRDNELTNTWTLSLCLRKKMVATSGITIVTDC